MRLSITLCSAALGFSEATASGLSEAISPALAVRNSTDYCPRVCDHYSVAFNPSLGFDLCGPSGSTCVSGVCTNLFWADLPDGPGRGLLNSEMETDLTAEEMSDPLTCAQAQNDLGIVPIRGIRDTQNTCYLNTALQILFHVPSIREYILGFLPSGNPFLNDFATLMRGVDSGNPSLDLTSIRIRDALQASGYSGFAPGVLGDVSEAITALVDMLDTSINPGGRLNITRSLVSHFAIINRVEQTCDSCGANSRRSEGPDMLLQARLVPGIDHNVTLATLLNASLSQDEYVDMRCSSCSNRILAHRVTRTVPSGEILMIQIGRAAADGSRINTPIVYPTILIHPLLASQYRLVGVAHHEGPRANDGHYHAEVLHGNTRWFETDDLRIVPSSSNGGDERVSRSATMLVYERI